MPAGLLATHVQSCIKVRRVLGLEMNIVFRTDASLQIGTGHVMRCLALTEALRVRGAQISFICRELPGNLIDLIRKRGLLVHSLPFDQDWVNKEKTTMHSGWLSADWQTDAEESKACLVHGEIEWLIVDHYAIDICWEQAMRAYCCKIMVVDDLADRMHDCDLLLDQNLGREVKDYYGLLETATTTLIGPQYALLRPEFSELRSESLARRMKKPQLHHLLVTMGGVDKENVTCQVLSALQSCTLPKDIRVTVVLGTNAPWVTQVQAQAKQMPYPTEVLVSVDNMAQLMVDSDLAIGASGSTSWERCCLGLPTIQIAVAHNQAAIAQAVSHAGAAVILERQDIAQILPSLVSTLASAEKLYEVSQVASGVTNGNGALLVCDFMKVNYENHDLVQ